MEKIILSTDEDITDFTDQEQVRVQVIDMELKQSCWYSGEQRMYTIFNGSQCYQRVRLSPSNKKKHRVNLGYLSESAEHHVKYAYGWFRLAMAMFILAVVLIFGDFIAIGQYGLILDSLAVFGMLIAGMSLLTGLLKSYNRVIFYSRYGKVPLLELIYQAPGKKKYNEFVDGLKQKIVTTNRVNRSSKKEYLSRELNELRRLKNECVITPTDFNKALHRIVNHSAYKD